MAIRMVVVECVLNVIVIELRDRLGHVPLPRRAPAENVGVFPTTAFPLFEVSFGICDNPSMFPDVCRRFRKQRFRPRGKKPCLQGEFLLDVPFPLPTAFGHQLQVPVTHQQKDRFGMHFFVSHCFGLALDSCDTAQKSAKPDKIACFFRSGECGFSTSVSSVADPEGKFCGVVTTFSSTLSPLCFARV